MNRVFVVQENPRLDYADAEKYGDVVFMTMREFSPMKNSISNGMVLGDIARHMAAFNPDEDYLLLTGGPIILGYTFSLALSKKGYVNVLQWDNHRRGYLPIRFSPDVYSLRPSEELVRKGLEDHYT